MKINKINFIKEFTTKFSFRQGKIENQAGLFLIDLLKKNKIDFQLFKFTTYLPRFKKFFLFADGKKINAQPCCFVGGKINSKYNLLSSLISSQKFIDTPNINFNPKCRDISLSNFYFAPSFAIHPKEIIKILKSEKIKGYIKVEKYFHQSFHILVGNLKNPKTISFAHYDSIGPGAIDNASGVATMINVIVSYPKLLNDHLFILGANEELSYDYPVYWGYGFRIFESKFFNLFRKSKKITVVDCVGHSKPQLIKDISIIKLGFPIKKLEVFKDKVEFIAGDLDKLMNVYHSNLDTWKNLKELYLNQVVKTFVKRIET